MKKPTITIIDYGMGNIRSVHNALELMGVQVLTTQVASEIDNADALVLPGVGAFGEAISNLEDLGLIKPIIKAVRTDKKPLLGICLGMQLLADSSDERGFSKGLSLIPGRVKLIALATGLRLPHVGWNDISIKSDDPLFAGGSDGDCFYFVHSYSFNCNSGYVSATTDYGQEIVAAVRNKHIFGVQFHPERSQTKGLRLLRNFIEYVDLSSKGM